MAASFTNRLNVQQLNELYEIFKKVKSDGGKRLECDDARGIYLKAGHFGYWTTPGGKTHDKVYMTPDTSTDLGQNMLQILKTIGEIVSNIVEKHFPADAALLREVPQEFRCFGLFCLAAVNLTSGKLYHLDKRDDGVCVIIPLGKYTHGGLGLSGFDVGTIALKLQMGDFAVLRGSEVYHSATDYEGERMSIVFCTKQKTRENGKRMVEEREKNCNNNKKIKTYFLCLFKINYL